MMWTSIFSFCDLVILNSIVIVYGTLVHLFYCVYKPYIDYLFSHIGVQTQDKIYNVYYLHNNSMSGLDIGYIVVFSNLTISDTELLTKVFLGEVHGRKTLNLLNSSFKD